MANHITQNLPQRNLWESIWVGYKQKCPQCHSGRIFGKFLKVKDRCDTCGQELHHHRADDAPPYFTIFILDHIIIPLMILVEKLYQPSIAIHMSIFIPLCLIMALYLLPRIKGALIGLQWSLFMHGFEEDARKKG